MTTCANCIRPCITSDGKCLVGEARQAHGFSPPQAWAHVTRFPYYIKDQAPVIAPSTFQGECRACDPSARGILLEAHTATGARREVASRFPQGAKLQGYDARDECVYITLVRARGDKHPVATATRGIRAHKFYARPL